MTNLSWFSYTLGLILSTSSRLYIGFFGLLMFPLLAVSSVCQHLAAISHPGPLIRYILFIL
jgi:hypothetical protein